VTPAITESYLNAQAILERGAAREGVGAGC